MQNFFVSQMTNQNYFYGLLRFNIWLMILDICLIGHFCISWWLNYKREKQLFNYWYFNVLLFFVIPLLFMYPFNGSYKNTEAVGNAYYEMEPWINFAYIISVLGYLSVWIGGMIRKYFCHSSLEKSNILDDIVVYALENEKVIRIVGLFMLICSFVFILAQFKGGYLGDPRYFFMQHSSYRPIYNLLISSFKFFVVFLGISLLKKVDFYNIVLLILLCCLGIFMGTRSTLLEAILYIAIFWSFLNKVKIWQFLSFGIIMLIAVFLLGKFRNNVPLNKAFDFILYGNSYSDTRDFAWILSCWDNVYVYGKTYLAGLISFIPSFISDYRETWAISRYTNNFVGFDSSIHPGLRPGRFGEPYFNFGLVGVVFAGAFLGYWLKYASDNINQKIKLYGKNGIIKAYAKSIPFLFSSYLCLTAGFFEIYSFIFLVLSMALIRKFLK